MAKKKIFVDSFELTAKAKANPRKIPFVIDGKKVMIGIGGEIKSKAIPPKVGKVFLAATPEQLEEYYKRVNGKTDLVKKVQKEIEKD